MHSISTSPRTGPAQWLPSLLPWLLWPVVVLLLLRWLSGIMWTGSVDLAHHYALVLRLLELGSLPPQPDPSLGEMNVYPHASHWMAAQVARLTGSVLNGIQVVVLFGFGLTWLAWLGILRHLPRPARGWALCLLVLLLVLNRRVLHLEVHGHELIANFFLAQMVATALGLLLLWLTLHGERAGWNHHWRNLWLLLGSCLLVRVHMLAAVQLAAFFAVLLLLEVWQGWQPNRSAPDPAARPAPGDRAARLRPWLVALAWLLVCALVMLLDPHFKAMRLISKNDGGMPLHWVETPGKIALYALLLGMAALGLLWRWLRLSPEARANWLVWKYLGLYGLALTIPCLLQVLALQMGQGSLYAVKKHGIGLHTLFILYLVLWGSWYFSRLAVVWQSRMRGSYLALWLAAVMAAIAPTHSELDVRLLLAWEQELMQLRGQVGSQSGKYTYVTQLHAQPGFVPYMFSIAIFSAPRTANAEAILLGKPLPEPALAHAVIRSSKEMNPPPNAACVRSRTAHELIWLDPACQPH